MFRCWGWFSLGKDQFHSANFLQLYHKLILAFAHLFFCASSIFKTYCFELSICFLFIIFPYCYHSWLETTNIFWHIPWWISFTMNFYNCFNWQLSFQSHISFQLVESDHSLRSASTLNSKLICIFRYLLTFVSEMQITRWFHNCFINLIWKNMKLINLIGLRYNSLNQDVQVLNKNCAVSDFFLICCKVKKCIFSKCRGSIIFYQE